MHPKKGSRVLAIEKELIEFIRTYRGQAFLEDLVIWGESAREIYPILLGTSNRGDKPVNCAAHEIMEILVMDNKGELIE